MINFPGGVLFLKTLGTVS